MVYFRLSLSKTEIEILVAILTVQDALEGKKLSLSGIYNAASIDYASLHREKDWLLSNKILKSKDINTFVIDFDNIAYLLFYNSNLRVLHGFALQYIDPPREREE